MNSEVDSADSGDPSGFEVDPHESSQLESSDNDDKRVDSPDTSKHADTYDTEDTEDKKLANGMGMLGLEAPRHSNELSETGQDKSKSPRGERILIEKDGKFELVDATAVKAEFFDLLGLGMESSAESNAHIEDEKPSKSPEAPCAADGGEADDDKVARPHTSPSRRANNFLGSKGSDQNNRSQSAAVKTRGNREYGGVRSRYGMTEQQLEMKKKREEALLRRKKEEDQRRKEEMERKRQDAELAFQVWLQSKNSEALERKKALSKNQKKSDSKEKEESAQKAYQAWLDEKARQVKQERYLERCRLEEEASSYVIRDRDLCEAAFQSWLRKKKSETNRSTKRTKKKKTHGREMQSSKTKRLKDYYGTRSALST